MAPLRYLTPFAFLAMLPLGGWLGGAWTFLGAVATPLCLAGLDSVLGDDDGVAAPASTGPRWQPRTYIVLQLAATFWAAFVAARPGTAFIEAAGLAISAGVTTGVFGFLAAHEMIHSRDPRERALGLGLLASVFYMHFRIAHLYGHHRRAATFDDPASARLGEGLYLFLARSIAGQVREAWRHEARQRRRRGRSAIGAGNRMIIYLAIELLLVAAMAMVNWHVLLFLGVVAVIAVVLLESFNYVAHYGLSRRFGERLGPHHSWNSARRMNNAALFNMGRHSDHHRHTARRFERLQPMDGAALLPSGYAAALLTACIPPLWRRAMDERAAAVMAGDSAA